MATPPQCPECESDRTDWYGSANGLGSQWAFCHQCFTRYLVAAYGAVARQTI